MFCELAVIPPCKVKPKIFVGLILVAQRSVIVDWVVVEFAKVANAVELIFPSNQAWLDTES